MSGWSLYKARMQSMGEDRRELRLNRSRDYLMRKAMDSPACHLVMINGCEQYVTITHKQDLSVKRICALPGETLPHGGLVEFANNIWMITELDADNELYERGLMQQCNHQLRWISKNGEIREKWCIVEDGTKYLIGERVKEFMSIGEARIAVTIAKDEETIELERGMRFLIDDGDTTGNNVLAYRITKPNRLFNVYNGQGVFRYILTECNLTENDNTELRIADYYNWKPVHENRVEHPDAGKTIEAIVENALENDAFPIPPDKEVWL